MKMIRVLIYDGTQEAIATALEKRFIKGGLNTTNLSIKEVAVGGFSGTTVFDLLDEDEMKRADEIFAQKDYTNGGRKNAIPE